MSITRVHVPMTDETRASLEALASARGGSLAAVCRDLLAECAPVALQLANALETAKTAPTRALREISDNLDKMLGDANQMQMDLENKLSPKATRRKRKAG